MQQILSICTCLIVAGLFGCTSTPERAPQPLPIVIVAEPETKTVAVEDRKDREKWLAEIRRELYDDASDTPDSTVAPVPDFLTEERLAEEETKLTAEIDAAFARGENPSRQDGLRLLRLRRAKAESVDSKHWEFK